MDRTAWFVGDEILSQRLGQIFHETPFCLRHISDAESGLTELAATEVPILLVDSRSSHPNNVTASLLRKIADGALPVINLFTIGDDFYPTSLAAILDLLAIDHFLCRDGQGLTDPHRLLEQLTTSVGRATPKCRHIQAFGMELRTYAPEFFAIVDDIVRVASRDVTILLVGETGTGKTTLAKIVHSISSRRGHPFQHLACGALPSDLIESELFGHTRGAFTGADRNKIGRFQAAGRGTLLLDEVDVLDLKQQTKLLKVIEEGEYEMVGSTEARKSEARLIVASNIKLQQLVDNGKFRLDLYYRLNVLEFLLPPLRERMLDLVPLAMQFVEELAQEHGIVVNRVHRDFLEALRAHDWPGNLRELKNHLRRAVLFCDNEELTINELSHKVIQSQFAPAALRKQPESSWKLVERVAQSEKEMLRAALEANDNNRTQTAKALGISRVGLYKKLRRLGLIDDDPATATEPIPA
ncbi:MAG: Acetoacetate metabolism regulatory protein ATOC [Planctomycetota bacterium]|nr:MAG: Acetoacetate metabolism regulatory protein ATOC [Planctomycetota bacterium]